MDDPRQAAATWALAASGQRAPGLQALRRCALCQHPVVLTAQPDVRCPSCHSPLAALPGDPGAEMLGRRGAVRRDQSHVALLRVGWPSTPLPVRWRDLSLTGLSVIAEGPVPVGRRIRVIDAGFDGVAEVIRCERQGKLHTVHARLLTAMFVQASGVFVRVRA